eukprot:TRINITY_DN270_c0_g1_i1.p1 TRINITY_DN270_c0_g1~~TRINITY_DN270_c0_g1_i1.p1  ORF type:complete len:463 (-),score=104.77 TRINITY_DN270_c0_g1_i1:97-1485(-)
MSDLRQRNVGQSVDPVPIADGITKPKDRSWGENANHGFFHRVVGPIFLMTSTPLSIVFFWIICSRYNGSLKSFAENITLEQLTSLDFYPWPDAVSTKIVLAFGIFEAILQLVLPGATFKGIVTRTGFRPTYKLNGVLAFFVTHFVFLYIQFYLKWFSFSIVYDNFGKILQTLSLGSFVICFLLYLKGLYAPSSADSGTTGAFIMDFYWGTELHPQLGPLNIKQWSNCRFGMMGWSVIINCFLIKQMEMSSGLTNSMIISVFIQQVYILKFYIWEYGYFNSLDIMYDRLGYYIYWGVSCWIPGVYCLVNQFGVNHPIVLETPVAIAITALGLVSVLVNYDCDLQRIKVRESDGKCLVWGKQPTLVRAQYVTADGVTHKNILLASGWWGISRHVHYIPEILLSVAWTLPLGLHGYILPWFYVVYLTILLSHRATRDEIRCAEKYGSFWKQYCSLVPYKMIPGIY